MGEHLKTDFLPTQRADAQVLVKQVDCVRGSREAASAGLVPEAMLILNPQRQVVFFNDPLRSLLECDDDVPDLVGLRVGELLHCVNSVKPPGGCGTTQFCRHCGAAQAIAAALDGQVMRVECRISCTDLGARDLRIWASPMDQSNERFVMLSIHDIADEKRRQALEQLFFHDLNNLAGGIAGYTELMQQEPSELITRYLPRVVKLAHMLSDQIQSQRSLRDAESGQLQAHPTEVDAMTVLNDSVDAVRNHPAIKERCVQVDGLEQQTPLRTDVTLLRRVVINMLVNALEATPAGGFVRCGIQTQPKRLIYWVWNAGVMSEEVQRQLFQRSFSTKGSGRGLGTYGMKLLGSRYLQGEISFQSDAEGGTRFQISVPRTLLDG